MVGAGEAWVAPAERGEDEVDARRGGEEENVRVDVVEEEEEEEREEEEAGDDRRLRVYRLRAAPFADLQAWLEEVAAFWTSQLTAFKAHAEGKTRKRKKK